MRAHKEVKENVERLARETKRKIGEVQHTLLPELRDMVSEQEFAERVGQRLAALPDDQRRLFSLQTALALSDLSELEDSLVQYMDLVATEIKHQSGVQRALTAYQQPSRTGSGRGIRQK